MDLEASVCCQGCRVLVCPMAEVILQGGLADVVPLLQGAVEIV